MADMEASGNTQWSRSGFANSFRRRGRKDKGSDTTSIASSTEQLSATDKGMDKVMAPFDRDRRSSTDSSSRKLSKILSGRKRRTKKADSDSGDTLSQSVNGGDGPMSMYSSNAASEEGPLATEDSGNFTEDSDSET